MDFEIRPVADADWPAVAAIFSILIYHCMSGCSATRKRIKNNIPWFGDISDQASNDFVIFGILEYLFAHQFSQVFHGDLGLLVNDTGHHLQAHILGKFTVVIIAFSIVFIQFFWNWMNVSLPKWGIGMIFAEFH